MMPDNQGIHPPDSEPISSAPAGEPPAETAGAAVSINTHGGDYAEGDIHKQGAFIGDNAQVHGTVVGYAEQVIQQSAEESYNVSGLRPNPYLGLRSFTYHDHAKYAGRERTIKSTLQLLTTPGEQRALLFVTGASGSGKSSFAQAGLLPALEAHYRQRNRATRWAVFRPSRRPLAGMADAWAQLGLPPFDGALTPVSFAQMLHDRTPPDQVNLMVIDQFEELFTQSEPEQRDALFALLEQLPPFEELRTHILATMRSDYLPELFDRKVLYDMAKQGVDLRAMRPDELREAILRPLQHDHPDGNKRFEPALLDRLAHDASTDAAHLPLLQVTLEELWAGGSLRLSAYARPSSEESLAYALQQRAEQAYCWVDYAADQECARPAAEQAAIMQILVELIEVASDDDPRRDVRRRRTYEELQQGSPERARLIEDLTSARLLSRGMETRGDQAVEVVDIIHEALIRTWSRLQLAIAEQRHILRQQGRFEDALENWRKNDCSDKYLLTGVGLEEAQALSQHGNVALRNPKAQELLAKSIAARDAERQQRLELAERAQREAEARAAEARRNLRRLSALAGGLLLALVLAGGLGWFANSQRREANLRAAEAQAAQALAQQQQQAAEQQARIARTRGLAAAAQAQLSIDPERSILLATEAVAAIRQSGMPFIPEAEEVLHQALHRSQVRATLHSHTEQVYSVAYSPDGASLLTASVDGTVKVWDVAAIRDSGASSGQERLALPHGVEVYSAVYSPDGRSILTAAADRKIRIWDAASGEERLTLEGHTGGVGSAAYSSDGRFIVSASQDSTVKIWDAASGEERLTLAGHQGPVYSAAYSPDGRFIASAGADGTVRVWSAEDGSEQYVLNGHGGPVLSVVYSPDGRFILTASEDGTARIWDTTSRQEYLALYGHEDELVSAAYSPDGRAIVTTSWDGTARLWDAGTSQELLVLYGHDGGVVHAMFSPDGRLVATGGSDGTARIWSVQSSQERPTLQGYNAAYSPDGRFVVTTGDEGIARVWDAATGTEQLALKGNAIWISSAIYSPDGRSILIGGNQTAVVWDAATGQQRLTLQGHQDGLASATYSADGRSILTTSVNGSVSVWDAASGEERLAIEDEAGIRGAAFSHDGRSIVTALGDGRAKIWDATSGQERLTLSGHKGGMLSAAYSPDDRFIVTTGGDKTARIWDAASGAEQRTLRHDVQMQSVSYSPDGRFIVTTSGKTVRVWEAATGKERLTLRQDLRVQNAAYSPDGRFIVTANAVGETRQYVMDLDELLRLAQSRVTRQLSDEERIQFGIEK